jgi:hypothetical protein
MPIPMICDCSAKLKVGDHLRGRHICCPKCGVVMPVGPAKGASNGAASARAALVPAVDHSPDEVFAAAGLSDEERRRVEDELGRGERVLWAGKRVVRWPFLFAWGLGAGLLFTALVLILVMVLAGNGGVFQGAGGTLTLVGMGLAAAGCVAGGVAWPFLARWYAGRVVYAVTSRRALAWESDWFGKPSLKVYKPADIANLYRVDVTRDADGVGNLVFGVEVERKKKDDGYVEVRKRYGFFHIKGAAVVERLLREHLLDTYLDRLYE